MIKEKIEKYELLGSLGTGGFCSVYKAVACDGRAVALKVLNPQLNDNPKIIDRFFREVDILSKLNHPNICRLLGFLREGRYYAIVMEYIDGIDLKELMLLESGSMIPFNRSVNIAGQCLEALQYAYEMGILHRDIKPSNIMIDKNENSIVTDFGIATVIDEASDDMKIKMLSVAYSPPERFSRIEKSDIRSDIYSLGMVFYELFTGQKPFKATDPSEIESWHRNVTPLPVNRLNSSLPLKINRAINTALEKKPGNRFKDFLEFKNAMGFEDNTEI